MSTNMNKSDPDIQKFSMIEDLGEKLPTVVGENFVCRGISRIFRRHTQKYDLRKVERKAQTETVLVRSMSVSDTDKLKGSESWVVVHKLKSQSDGGILDPDDKLVDVADDREQIMAIYEEDNDGMPSLQHNAGDGTSASSVGTNSPDIFQGSDHKFQPFARTDIEITGEELSNGHVHGSASPNSSGVTLQVRRGSEPALNRMSPVHLSPPDPSKRWSAAPIIDEDVTSEDCHKGKESRSSRSEELLQCNGDVPNSSQLSVNSSSRENSVIFSKSGHYSSQSSPVTNLPRSTSSSNSTTAPPPTNIMSVNSNFVQYRNNNCDSNSNGLNVPSRFSRDTNRLSMQINVDGGAKWVDAADRALSLSLRKEPVGANANTDNSINESLPPQSHFINNNNYNSSQQNHQKGVMREEHNNFYVVTSNNNRAVEQSVEIVLRYEVGPLGVHLVPEHTSGAKNQGLVVQGVEQGGRIDRDGRVTTGDKIIEINGHSLLGVPFLQAQDLFREGLSTPELRLKIVKNSVPEFSISTSASNVQQLVSKFSCEVDEKENMVQSHERIVGDAKIATVSPTKKMSLQPGPLARPSTTTLIAQGNTRKIGRKYDIDLQKGSQGLGFSITTRDNPAGGNCPIYIKNILPTGAAIDDGRLRPGDRLLEVNGIEITGKSQSDAVSILRNVPQGGIVKLVVSRQERVDLSPKLPRQLPPDKITDDVPAVPWSEREVLALDIPVLDTEKAGLGISVKGKTTAAQRGNMIDMGIYIKSVIHGGAASRDGRLKSNDQLMSINGVSLLDRSNTDAMETLRRTMTQDNGPKPKPGFITLTIGRRVPSSSAPTTDISGCGSSASGDEMDSWSTRNVSMSADGVRQEDMTNGRTSKTPENRIGFVPTFYANNRAPMVPGQNQNLSNSLRRGNDQSKSQSPSPYGRGSLDLPRNPVLDRLTGKSNNQAMRNESYYRATHETWNATMQQSMVVNAHVPRESGNEPTRIVQNGKGEMILYEGDYSPPEKPPRRSRSSTPEDRFRTQERVPNSTSDVPTPAASINVVELPAPSDITYASQTSLEEGAGGFARDAFGRQSMSEKRHATLDAKNTDTYQRNKKLREERERQKLLQDQQEEMNNRWRSEQLARERNLQDELARRGIKRPFSSSTEDELQNRVLLPPSNQSPNNTQYDEYEEPDFGSQSCAFGIGKKGLGDQLKELLHQWGHKQTRSDAVGLPRTNSADSLVEALKMKQQENTHRHQSKQTQQTNEINFKGSKKDIGPSLGMKKSSSLESLQTMVQEIQNQEDLKAGFGPARAGPAAVRVIRGRGCNESFRQAVDRSYDAPLGELGMETLAEEETESCISGGTFGRSQKQPYPECTDDPEGIYGKKAPAKKKPGLFRGLGSMFRFGRHRKSSHGNSALSASEIRKQQAEMERMEKEDNEMAQRDRARQVALAEQMRIQEQYRRLVEKQKQDEAQQGRNPGYGMTVSISSKSGANLGYTNKNSSSSQSQLRPQHPFRKSMDPQSIREKEREMAANRADNRDVNGNSVSSGHARAASYDVYNEMTRPGSRVGFVDPKKYSHYINYEEIRHHLNDKIPSGEGKLSDAQLRQMRNTVVEQRKKAILESRRHQQHYHSQRRESPRERHERPVSNFYEYESVKAAMHVHGQQGVSLGHPHPHGQPIYGMNSHSGVNNNGVTLPSPSTLPHTHNTIALHQLSPSQFQAVPPVSHSRQQQNSQGHNHIISNLGSSTLQHNQQKPHQQQKPNSLPRFNQKEMLHSVQVQPPLSSTNHRHAVQQQQQQMPGRYTIPHSHSSSSSQMFRPQPGPPSHSASSRLTHYHNHPNGVLRNPSTTTLGSKV